MRERLINDSEFLLSPTLATPKSRDHAPEGFEAGLRRSTPQLGTQLKALQMGIFDEPLMPTPAVGHIRNHDEPIENYLERRQDYVDGKTKGMPGASLGVAVRMELLRSPKASEGQGGALGEAVALERGNTVGVRDQVMDLVASQGKKVSRAAANNLLPTPRANEPGSTSLGYGDSLNDFANRVTKGYAPKDLVEDLLPTVTTQDGKNNGGPSQFERNTKPLNTQVLIDNEWGKFGPAIRRWEHVLDRSAPAPTKPDGKEGSHRLSSRFTEWMMGVPDGWITEAGLTRTEELKACGNGVVPQQAELALSVLLDGLDLFGDAK